MPSISGSCTVRQVQGTVHERIPYVTTRDVRYTDLTRDSRVKSHCLSGVNFETFFYCVAFPFNSIAARHAIRRRLASKLAILTLMTLLDQVSAINCVEGQLYQRRDANGALVIADPMLMSALYSKSFPGDQACMTITAACNATENEFCTLFGAVAITTFLSTTHATWSSRPCTTALAAPMNMGMRPPGMPFQSHPGLISIL